MMPAIRDTILAYLYDHFFPGHQSGDLHHIKDQFQVADHVFWDLLKRMRHDGLIVPAALGAWYRIAPAGIVFVEANQLADPGRIRHHRRIRTHLLERLMKVYEAQGSHGMMNYQMLATEIGSTDQEARDQLLFLDQAGLIDCPYSGGNFRLTDSGRVAVLQERIAQSLSHDFASAQALPPAKRGKALEQLIAAVALRVGWTTEANIITPGEELDVVIVKDHAYYLIECKWYSKPVEAKYIREFYGKLANRTGFRGLFVSMSGFTSGAVDQVRTYINQHPICCLGPLDVDAVINGTLDFSELVEQRYRRLITQRHVEWS